MKAHSLFTSLATRNSHHFNVAINNMHKQLLSYMYVYTVVTVPLDLNFTHARAQKATARNIHGNAPE